MTAIALTIAGSDSSGGAGIQADLKTFSALGVYGASAITALTAQNTLGVEAVHAVPPDFILTQIEAVARTPIMGFRDDVAIRIRPDDDGSKIDVRSASRYGRHDFGGNASRIRSLLEDIEARADSEEKREQRQQQKQQQPKPAAQAGKRS